MVEWHVTPDYIENNWTDELLTLMTEKLVERKERQLQTLSAASTSGGAAKISDVQMFARAGNLIKVEKK